MKSLTWTWESHGLFDYESKSIKKKDIKAENGGYLIWKADQVEFTNELPEDLEADPESTLLFSLLQNKQDKGTQP